MAAKEHVSHKNIQVAQPYMESRGRRHMERSCEDPSPYHQSKRRVARWYPGSCAGQNQTLGNRQEESTSHGDGHYRSGFGWICIRGQPGGDDGCPIPAYRLTIRYHQVRQGQDQELTHLICDIGHTLIRTVLREQLVAAVIQQYEQHQIRQLEWQ